MKCNNCGGTGHCNDVVMVEGGFATRVTHCPVCNGTSEIRQTEQEYIQTCTTEQLAEEIYEYAMTPHWQISKEVILEWLKQPHTTIKE